MWVCHCIIFMAVLDAIVGRDIKNPTLLQEFLYEIFIVRKKVRFSFWSGGVDRSFFTIIFIEEPNKTCAHDVVKIFK